MEETFFKNNEETETWIVPKGKWVCPFIINGLLLVDKPVEIGDDQVIRFVETVKKEKRLPTDILLSMKIEIPKIVEKRIKHHLYGGIPS